MKEGFAVRESILVCRVVSFFCLGYHAARGCRRSIKKLPFSACFATADCGGCRGHRSCAYGVSAARGCSGAAQPRDAKQHLFGLLLPQSTLPTISGPPNPENDMTNVWGSAVGFLVSWEPFDLVSAAQTCRSPKLAKLEHRQPSSELDWKLRQRLRTPT